MKKTRKISTKVLSILLSLAIAVVSLPMGAFAADYVNDQDFEQDSESSLLIQKEPVELVDERTADTKRFRMEDGSFVVAQYDTAVHYLDENGRWQDIDNRLTADGSEISTSNAKIKFAKKTTGNGNLFALHDGNRKITLSLNGANKKVEGQITNFETDFGEDTTKLEKMTTLDRVSASVKYENILENTDLEYVLHGLNIKENIIVKAKGDSYAYSFTMALNQLSAQKTSKGEIEILDSETNEVVYLIPAPIMWDAGGVSSYATEYTLTDLGNGKYNLTVTADSSWMNDAERVYPVTIDPAIYAKGPEKASDFTYNVNTQTYDTNSGELWVGANYISYWRLNNLPQLPTSAYVASAEFSLNGYDNNTNGNIGIYEVLDESDTGMNVSYTLENNLTYSDIFTDFDTVYNDGIVMDSVQSFSWDITPLVKKWYESEHFGLIIAPVNSSDFTGYVRFFSEEYAQTSMRPVLSITYYDMKGIESYWGFTSQSVGFAGSGAVNHALGQLVFTIPTLTTTDALMPYTPTLVYNSSMSGMDFDETNVQTMYATPHAAKGFKWNFQESLRRVDLPAYSGDETFLVYSDSDGTEHYFYHYSGNVYRDEDGLQLTLEYNAESNEYTMTDSAENKRVFKHYPKGVATAPDGWYLASISDFHGNQLLFDFDAAYRVTGINLLPNGYSEANKICQMKIEYLASGAPYVVWNPNSKEAVIFRYSTTPTGNVATNASQYLRQVVRVRSGDSGAPVWENFYNTNANSGYGTFVVDAVAEYVYNSNGVLLKAINHLAKISVAYEFNSKQKVVSVREYAITDSGNVSGQRIYFVYGIGNTQIRTAGTDDVFGNSDDLLTTYTYDAHGRTVGSYTTNLGRTNIYSASHGSYIEPAPGDYINNRLTSSVQTAQHSSNYLLNGGFEDSSIDNYWNSSGAVWFSGEDTYQGTGAVKLQTNEFVSQSWIAQDVALDAGKYSISLMYKSADMRNVRMYIKAESTNTAHSVVKEIPVNADAADSYSYAGIQFTAEPDTAGGKETFTVTVMISGSPLLDCEPTVYVDNIMLSRTTGAAEYDMVKMGHFESTHSLNEAADFWSYAYTGAPDVTVVDSEIGAFGDVLKMEAPIGDARGIVSQTIPLNFSEPQSKTYTLSAWAKGTAQSSSGYFSIDARVNYVDANGASDYTYQAFDFCKTITDWQFISGCFETDPTKGTPVSIEIVLFYTDHPGAGYFDSISLVESSSNATVYEYDTSNANLEAEIGGLGSTYYFYGDENYPHWPTRVASSNGTVIDYGYEYVESTQRFLQTEFRKKYSADGNFDAQAYTTDTEQMDGSFTLPQENLEPIVISESISDLYGLPIASTVYDASDTNNTNNTTPKSTTTATYNTGAGYEHIFGTLASETTARGARTLYYYNSNTGWLLATIYPDLTGTAYIYDGMGNLLRVEPCDWLGSPTAADDNEVHYTYEATTNRLSTIVTDSTTYTFAYDNFGNSKYVKAGSYAIVGYTYNANNGKLSILTYGNGLKVKYLYDSLDRVSEISYNTGDGGAFETVYSYTYDSVGHLFSIEDHVSGEVTVYRYDSNGRFDHSYVYDTETYQSLYNVYVDYDENSRLRVYKYSLDYAYTSNNASSETLYQYSTTYNYSNLTGNLLNCIIKTDTDGFAGELTPMYDKFGRTLSKQVQFSQGREEQQYFGTYQFWYEKVNDNLTNAVSELIVSSGSITTSQFYTTVYKFTYNDNGDVIQIADANDDIQYRYEYDALGQLTREDNYPMGLSYVYTYDTAGNILKKERYALIEGELGAKQSTINYYYGDSTWGDLLTNVGGDSIEYDEIGNPVKIGYYDSTEEYWQDGKELRWEGKLLTSVQNFECYGAESEPSYYSPISFTYNADGIRTGKTVDGVEHRYFLDGNKVLAEIWMSGNREHQLHFIYDESGSPIAIRYRNSWYEANVFDNFYFEKNLQGDIVAVYNEIGVRIGTYSYDAWGKVTAVVASGVTGIGRLIVNTYNPFRYRGSFYDVETGLYYLQGRYYNPTWGRFINSSNDIGVGTSANSYNAYAYACNEPTFSASEQALRASFVDNGNITWYNVPIYDQNGYSLCWAVSDLMIRDYKTNTYATAADAETRAIDIAKSVNGETLWNNGAWPKNADQDKKITIEHITLESLKNYINDGPIYGYFDNPDVEKDAHLIVITGVDLDRELVYTNNPWGVSGVQTFEAFKAGYIFSVRPSSGPAPFYSAVPLK